MLAKASYRAPSEITGVAHLLEELTGIPAPDQWTAYQFDSAVVAYGTYIESKLHELDKDGAPKHSLDSLLHPERRVKGEAIMAFFAGNGFEIVEG